MLVLMKKSLNNSRRVRSNFVALVPMAISINVSRGINGSKGSLNGTFNIRRQMPFRKRVNKTTSVIVTITFILIFVFIIAMEILFMDDEGVRFNLQNKIPDQERANAIEDDGTAVDTVMNTYLDFQFVAKEVLQIKDFKRPAPTHNRSSHINGDVTNKPPINNNVDSDVEILLHPKPKMIIHDVAATRTRALRQETLLIKEHIPHVGHSYVPVEKETSGGKWSHEPITKGAKDDWQPVIGAQNKFYVYSAYLDMRQGSFIRVIGATRTRGSDKVSCLYWYTTGDKKDTLIVPANNKVIRENWNLKYSAIFILCPLFVHDLGRKVPVPDEVSIVITRIMRESNSELHGLTPVGNRLHVLNSNVGSGINTDSVGSFAVCVKPLHYHYNRAMQLIEFIELNRILGVQHFTFYNHTIGSEVDCILRSYVQQGLVTVLPWQLGIASQKEIRTEGLFAAINDCLYRNMYKYRYLLMIDFDEYIIPHHNTTLNSIIQEHNKKVDKVKVASFSFMNSFFYLQWPNDTNARNLPPLVTLQKTKRRAKFHPHKQRSKCIILPKFVVEMGNHFVWEFLPGKGAVNVPPDLAFLHHYRVCEFGGNDCIKTQSVTDRTVYRYKEDLVQKVEERLKKSSTEGSIQCRKLDYRTQLKR